MLSCLALTRYVSQITIPNCQSKTLIPRIFLQSDVTMSTILHICVNFFIPTLDFYKTCQKHYFPAIDSDKLSSNTCKLTKFVLRATI